MIIKHLISLLVSTVVCYACESSQLAICQLECNILELKLRSQQINNDVLQEKILSLDRIINAAQRNIKGLQHRIESQRITINNQKEIIRKEVKSYSWPLIHEPDLL